MACGSARAQTRGNRHERLLTVARGDRRTFSNNQRLHRLRHGRERGRGSGGIFRMQVKQTIALACACAAIVLASASALQADTGAEPPAATTTVGTAAASFEPVLTQRE